MGQNNTETHSDRLINRLCLRKAQLSKISNDKEFDWFVYFAELDNSKIQYLETITGFQWYVCC